MNPALSVPLIMAARQRRYIRNYREAGATEPGLAKTPAQVGCRPTPLFRRLVRAGLFVEVDAGAYYLDTRVADAFTERRRRRSVILIGLLAVLLLLLVLAKAVGG